MLGGSIVLLSCIVSLLGYHIMPDSTPNANDGAVQIQKQAPGFRVKMIRLRKNVEIPKQNLVFKAFFGQESQFMIVPISSWKFEGLEVVVEVFGRDNYIQRYDLADAVLALYPENLQSGHRKYQLLNDVIHYRNDQGESAVISIHELRSIFEKEHIIERKYLLGTDRAGRDLLSRLIFGTRISLSIGIAAVVISVFLGLVFGSLSGYFGGWVDTMVMWFMSVTWAIPGIMLVISISIALQSRGIWVAFLAVGFSMWVEVARVVRGQVMAIKAKTFVEAARAFGFTDYIIMFRHILPNITGPLIVVATVNFASAILLEAGLSFLGLSVQPPTPSWGAMMYEGFNAIGTQNSLHLILFPGLAICILVMAFNVLGNGLRDAFDPKSIK
ncbi:MAG: ABC transporter permease [Cyclobacteriaceae bacterium]|nr:ABC transporter permease [Cyclobacteriaceae bacterium]